MPLIRIINQQRTRFNKMTLRVRLTAWYILLLGVTLGLFSVYLYGLLKHNLSRQMDTSLEVTASETLNLLVEQKGKIKLKHTLGSDSVIHNLTEAGFMVRLTSRDGNVWDGFGHYQLLPQFLPKTIGYTNIKIKDQLWRIYNLEISLLNTQGWLQIGQPLQSVSKTLDHLLILMLLSFPLVLMIAACGGLFLADRALIPIERIIRTAEAINRDEITCRINYQGSLDEVGRLANTLDRMLDRLQAALDHERRFIADASHELRTPLTVIKGRIGVTLSRLRTPEEYVNTLQQLDQEVDRLIRLANGLLFLTRLEQETLTNQTVNLSNLLEILVEQLAPLAEEKNIEIIQNIELDLIIYGHSDYLTSLFLNLLDNAIKYTPNQGIITVKTALVEQGVNIVISNTGVGISPQYLPHLFERFYRVEEARSRQTGGAGLGLAIAYEIARLHQGLITVQSQTNNITTFTVYLPVQ
ncbi:sensor histidine kinase [Crocosphaera sp. XPORK-15E]|uniref:sensor histidine kinase n=1 Tax=Crocosphaera sp. XPORK-15E TaxID=3110247 RepID=UPI002B21B957|nr:ATP-binding protein [Crocosphaera sp. XPORK-15E]MEA5534712.1 ATP-binding protein [Crocosphaera sp. XPORK-15E]